MIKKPESKKANVKKQFNTSGKYSKSNAPVLCDNFEIKKYHYTPLDTKNERNKAQSISYPRYGEGNFVFETPFFKITQYGLPSLGEFVKDDEDRNYLKLALDPTQPECTSMEKMFTSIDKYTDTSKDKIFDKFAKLYSYKPIIREPRKKDELELIEEEENQDKDGKPQEEKVKYKFWRAKFDISYEDKKILTPIFVRDPSAPEEERVRKVEVSTATDLEEYVTWNSEVRLIVMANKLWAEKNKKDANAKFREYAISFKILQLEVIPREKSGGSIRNSFVTYAFQNPHALNQTLETKEESKNEQNNDLDNNTQQSETVETVETVENDDSNQTNASNEQQQQHTQEEMTHESEDNNDNDNNDENEDQEDEQEQVAETPKTPEPVVPAKLAKVAASKTKTTPTPKPVTTKQSSAKSRR
jgi:hypothetical protein